MEKQVVKRTELLEFQPKTAICFISKGRVISIGFDEITHISKSGGETVISTINNRYKTHHSLQEILNDLPVNEFFKIHRLHIVSLRFMKGTWKNKVIVNEYFLPVTKYYKEQLSEKLAAILNRNYLFILPNERKVSTAIQ